MFALPLSRRRLVLPATLGLLAAALVLFAGCAAGEGTGKKGKISGAYLALSHWGDSRTYPGDQIPAGAFTLAYEYSKSRLRPPQAGVEGPIGAALGRDAGWAPIGPLNGGGRTLLVAFHPTDPNTIFAGAASGGLWRSTTAGVGPAAWERVDTGHPVLGVSSIAFAPDDPNVMYIGTGEVYNVEASGDLEADRRTRGSYGIGVLKSADGGVTWVKSLDWSYNQRHGVWAVRVDPLDADIVWAATTDGIYKSTDAGLNWVQKLDVVMGTDLVVHPDTPDRVLAGCGDLGSADRGIYRTVNGGDTWAQITGGGIPADFQGKIQFGVTAADPDVVYASVGNGFNPPGGPNDNFTWLLRSDDFGASFTLRSTTDYSRWQGWYSHDVAVSPTDPDTIICVGIDTWKSTNGGATLTRKSSWSSYFSGDLAPGGPEGYPDYSHADHHDVVYHPTDPDVFYLGTDGGVFRSTDGGETYEGANGGYQSQQFYNGSYCSATDPQLAMGGLQDNASVIYRGDSNWARWVLGGDGGWCAIHPTNPNLVYATAQFLYVGRSTNGGTSFTIVSPDDLGGPVAFIAPFVMSPTNPSVLYAGSNYFFKSFDGGDLWYIGQGGAEIDGNPMLLLAVAAQNDDVVYLATAPYADRGRVHRTLDGGSTFTDLTGSLPDRYPGDLAVDPTDEATVYLTLSGFGSSHLFKSTDYGTTWTDIDQGVLPDVPTTAVIVDPLFPDHVYVGNDIGVYFTPNDGATWVQLAIGLSEAVLVHELNISLSNRKLRAFTHGQGVFERDLVGNDCPADVDGDGVVGVADFLALLAAWGPCPECPQDIDGDGIVGVEDFLELLAGWGTCP